VFFTRYYWSDQIKNNEVGGARGSYEDRVLVGKPEEKSHLEALAIDGSVTLKWIFKKWDCEHGLNCSGSGQGQVGGACECGNEPSVSIKFANFLTR
jgi:hypothetical protein